MLRVPSVRRLQGEAIARLLDPGMQRSARTARELLATQIAEHKDSPVDDGRVVRDRLVWPLFWARTTKHPAGYGVLLVLPEELPALKDPAERDGLLLMMAEIAPVWSDNYHRLAPTALSYLRAGIPPEWARELEAGDE
ncbi:hypothetical protein J7F01_32890 [Streptomyces sp. ISL-22]|uniref:hypothetical protein n=1 Tax=unclassified Streptomyces TaxID=2593676 RepID=UPI001BE53B9D|nr:MULTISPECIES: hypothetical protein [unclassified Streptomyces]MBT2419372.1 hypothetical protein [Streptomyces sp. ISL-24]MBT2436868.1 hypothetical protein [Streptomyces sp. ISL-22]